MNRGHLNNGHSRYLNNRHTRYLNKGHINYRYSICLPWGCLCFIFQFVSELDVLYSNPLRKKLLLLWISPYLIFLRILKFLNYFKKRVGSGSRQDRQRIRQIVSWEDIEIFSTFFYWKQDSINTKNYILE